MNREILVSFLQAGKALLGSVIGQVEANSKIEDARWQPELHTNEEISVHIKISGHLQGVVVLGTTRDAARKIASRMMSTGQIQPEAALGELGNMISGHALAELSKTGYECGLTPPRIRHGAGIVRLQTPAITIPYNTPYGRLHVTLAVAATVRPYSLALPGEPELQSLQETQGGAVCYEEQCPEARGVA